MEIHSSILAWRNPWTDEPGRLQAMGWKELDTTEQLPHKAAKKQIKNPQTFITFL